MKRHYNLILAYLMALIKFLNDLGPTLNRIFPQNLWIWYFEYINAQVSDHLIGSKYTEVA